MKTEGTRALAKGETGFVEIVVMPWWAELCRLLPGLAPLNQRLVNNAETWRSIANYTGDDVDDFVQSLLTQYKGHGEPKTQRLWQTGGALRACEILSSVAARIEIQREKQQ